MKQVSLAVFLVTLATVVSRLLGLAREAIFAATFGATATSDALLTAMMIPTILFSFFGQGLTSCVVPIVTNRERAQGRANSYRVFNGLLTTSVLVATVLTLIGIVESTRLVNMVVPGFSPEAKTQTVLFTRIMFPTVSMLVISTMLGGLLQVHSRFVKTALTGIPLNICILASLVWVKLGHASAWWVALGVCIGTGAQVLLQLSDLRGLDYAFEPILALGERWVGEARTLMGPMVLATSADQLQSVVERLVGSTLVTGSITALNYGNRIATIPQTTLVAALVTVIYPQLSRALSNPEAFLEILTKTKRILWLLVVPLVVIFVLKPSQIVAFLLAHGAFGSSATQRTATVLVSYSLGLVPLALRDLYQRAFFALGDSTTPTYLAVAGIGVNVVIDFWAGPRFGVSALAVGAATAGVIQAIGLSVLLNRRFRKRVHADDVRWMLKLAASVLVMAGSVIECSRWVATWHASGFIKLVLPVALGLIVYVIAGVVFAMDEVKRFTREFGKKCKVTLSVILLRSNA